MAKQKNIIREEYQDDVLELFRKVVGGVTLSDLKNFDSLRGKERIDFLKFCRETFSNDYFDQVIKHIISECVLKAAMESQNMDQVLVNRASANGVKLVEDFFLKYNNIHIDELEIPKQKFDSTAPFEVM